MRAIVISAVMFAVSLAVNAVAARKVGVDLEKTRPSELPWSMWAIGFVSVALLSTAAAVWFFAWSSTTPTALSGLAFGTVMLGCGIALDCLFILPLRDGAAILRGYFTSWQYWATLALLLACCTAVGALRM